MKEINKTVTLSLTAVGTPPYAYKFYLDKNIYQSGDTKYSFSFSYKTNKN